LFELRERGGAGGLGCRAQGSGGEEELGHVGFPKG
jgi:hypothetical protein